MSPSRLAAFVACALAGAAVPAAQDAGDQMRHSAFFVVEATGSKVQPPSTSSATATGAFIVDAEKRTLTYELTYHGLENGPPQSIAIHNFGAGGNGERVQVICGAGGPACPTQPSATMSGSATGAPAIAPERLVEYATGRMYLEIVGGNGRAELRGQLEPNNSMIHPRNFVANLTPASGKGSGTGTAVLSEVTFADGHTNVFYRVTVARTSGAPDGVSLSGMPAAEAAAAAPAFSSRTALPQGRALATRAAANGGTFTGQYQVPAGNTTAPLATRMLSAGDRSVAISVRTSKFPTGELVGIFREVH